MRMLLVVAVALAAAVSPAWGQKARAVEGMSQTQRADYGKLMRAYVSAFRTLGRAKFCRLDFDAGPYLREVAVRHGEKSEAVRLARLSFAAGAEEGPEIDQAPPAPVPCDVVALMRDLRLAELPASLVERAD
jgi:hypothetical protein